MVHGTYCEAWDRLYKENRGVKVSVVFPFPHFLKEHLMKKLVALTLIALFSGVLAPVAEAGPIAKIHRAKINLIKKVVSRIQQR